MVELPLGDFAGHFANGLGDSGLMGFHLGHESGKGVEKHAAVPEEVAAGEEFFGGVEVGFFGEFIDFFDIADGQAAVDIAESGFGSVGSNSDGDDGPLNLGGGHCSIDGGFKLGLGGDSVIGGEDGNGGGGPGFGEFGDEGCGDPGKGTGGVAFCGFGKDVFAGQVGAGLGADFSEVSSGGDVGAIEAGEGSGAVDGLLNEGFGWVGELEELLWSESGADGPEAFAGSSGHDDGNALIHF